MNCPKCGIKIAAAPHPDVGCPDCDALYGAISFCLWAAGTDPTAGGMRPAKIACHPRVMLTYLNRARDAITPDLTEAFNAAEAAILPYQAAALR